MNGPDDGLDDLEARLRAWRPAAVPPALLARLLAAAPPPRRPRHLLKRVLWGVTVALGIFGWRIAADLLSSRTSDGSVAARRVPGTARFVDVAWAPGASLTMNLATGMPAGNVPGAWSLDGDVDASAGLFLGVPTDGKLPLKVDCQF